MPSPLAAPASVASGVLDRARDHFESPKRTSGAVAVGLVLLVTAGTVAGVFVLGTAFDATIDREVTVDNPDRPPESTCDAFGDDEDSLIAEQCDRPARIDVDVGAELRSATTGYAGYAVVGIPIWWVVFGLVLHGGARFAGGSGSVGESFVIAAWAIVPELVRLAAGLAAIWYALATTTIEGTTMRAVAEEVIAAIGAVSTPLLAVSAVVIAVQWVIVVGGLEAVHDLDRGTAGTVAGVLAALAFLIALV